LLAVATVVVSRGLDLLLLLLAPLLATLGALPGVLAGVVLSHHYSGWWCRSGGRQAPGL
jgi:hypothetical protein